MLQRKSAWRDAPVKNGEEMTDEDRSAHNTPPTSAGDQDAQDFTPIDFEETRTPDNLAKVPPIPAARRKGELKADKFALTEEQKQKIHDAFDLLDRAAPPRSSPAKKLNKPETSTGISPWRNDDDQALTAREGSLRSRRTRSGRKQLAPEVALALFRESERINISMSNSIDQLLFTELNSPMMPIRSETPGFLDNKIT
jgi:hypothetical protein